MKAPRRAGGELSLPPATRVLDHCACVDYHAGMPRYPLYQIDAFVLPDRSFSGNPAAVVPVGPEWPTDELMKGIAAENNLAETAFLRAPDERDADRRVDYEIRWFTPTMEVDLCGHATLASAYAATVVMTERGAGELVFSSPRSGRLPVSCGDDDLVLDFPADLVAAPNPGELARLAEAVTGALGAAPTELYAGRSDLLAVFDDPSRIAGMAPDLRKLASLPTRGVIVTAAASDGHADFVSRFFAPQVGIDEDPVTGSAHTTLAPFWGSRLGKTVMTAEQLSARGGRLRCELRGDRVLIGGRARLYLQGEIAV